MSDELDSQPRVAESVEGEDEATQVLRKLTYHLIYGTTTSLAHYRRVAEQLLSKSAEREVFAETNWSVEDLMQYRGLSRENAEQCLIDCEDSIMQSQIEAGWAIIDEDIRENGYHQNDTDDEDQQDDEVLHDATE